jgi:hypothetical protein
MPLLTPTHPPSHLWRQQCAELCPEGLHQCLTAQLLVHLVPVKGHIAHRQLVQAAQLTRKLQVNRSTGQDITAQYVRMQSARYEV